MTRLIMVIAIVIILSACSVPITDVEFTSQEMVKESIITLPTAEPTPNVTEQITSKPTEKPTVKPTTKSTKQLTPVVTTEPTPTPIVTEKPTTEPTPATTPKPTPKPTQAPEFTVISGQIRSGALQGINEARDEEGNPAAQLDGGLNSQAEAHAITMAKADNLFHSSMGYVESVRSGAFIGGWAEGYGAANHATQLCLDVEIVRIGVGSAISADGTVYTCIIGAR